MADDKDKTGAQDRDRVAAGEGYEVSYFAQKHGISEEDARALIARIGNDRGKLDAAAGSASKRKSPSAASGTRARRAPPAKSQKSSDGTGARAKPGNAVSAGAAALVDDAARSAAKGGAAVAGATRLVARTSRRASSAAKARVTALPSATKKAVEKGVARAATATRSKTVALVGAAAAGLAAGLAVNLGRKALVQAPSALSGDWFDAVKTEHAMALALFDQLQKTTSDEGAKRSTLLMQLKHALGKHAFMEENVLYPALREHGDKADADKLNHDHGYVKQYLYDLENLDSASTAFLAMVDDFRREIEEHIREEESSIFPPLHAALGPDANAKLTAQANKEAFKLA